MRCCCCCSASSYCYSGHSVSLLLTARAGAVRAVPEATRFAISASSSATTAFLSLYNVDMRSSSLVRPGLPRCCCCCCCCCCLCCCCCRSCFCCRCCGCGCCDECAAQVGEELITHAIWTSRIVDCPVARAPTCVDMCVSSGSIFSGWSDGRVRIFNFVRAACVRVCAVRRVNMCVSAARRPARRRLCCGHRCRCAFPTLLLRCARAIWCCLLVPPRARCIQLLWTRTARA